MSERQYHTAEVDGRVVAVVTIPRGELIEQRVTDLETGDQVELDGPLLCYPHIRVTHIKNEPTKP